MLSSFISPSSGFCVGVKLRQGDYTPVDQRLYFGGRTTQAGEQFPSVLAHGRRIRALLQALAVQLDRQRRDMDALSRDFRLQQAARGLEMRILEQVPGDRKSTRLNSSHL